jgi:nicotinate-nucleotide pyrophosphorylase (carboxylating)
MNPGGTDHGGPLPGGPLPPAWLAIVRAALAEDLGQAGDVTSSAVIPEGSALVCDVVFRQEAVVCGLALAEAAFAEIDPGVRCQWLMKDGDVIRDGESAGRVTGSASSVLAGERTALNLISYLSAIATCTARFVKAVGGTGVAIYDTRKTTPGLRPLDKYAVRCGGGHNHRMGLFDQVLIKDNHLRLAGGIVRAVTAARDVWGGKLPIEVEVESAEDAMVACRAGADIVMLDNIRPAEMRKAVLAVRAVEAERGGGRCLLEASGGVTMGNVVAVAQTGVDRIAVGGLTAAGRVDVAFDEVRPDVRR